MEFQQSRTYSNLQNAYEIELMMSSRDLIYSDRARQEGYIQISNIFEVISKNNREHARIWLRRLNEGILPSTSEFLQAAFQEESYNGNELYREYARIAREEGFDEISSLFSGIANIDINHSQTFLSLYDDIERSQVFCKPQETLWICMQCGNIMYGDCAPEICPVCGFPQGFYMLYNPIV
ncbi:MAG TPA: rubrerythrin family protein [Mobilitalea sp.]|nr:rubrerythrin family protein [Mobilitalea sp.]